MKRRFALGVMAVLVVLLLVGPKADPGRWSGKVEKLCPQSNHSRRWWINTARTATTPHCSREDSPGLTLISRIRNRAQPEWKRSSASYVSA